MKKDIEIRRRLAIAVINCLYPPDSNHLETAQAGRELLDRARIEVAAWRNEPIEVLERFAQLCQWKDDDITRRIRRAD